MPSLGGTTQVVVTTSNGICTWSGWGGMAATALHLYVTAAIGTAGSSGSFLNTGAVSLDGGSTFTNLFSATGSVASAAYSFPIPSGQDLSLVQFQVSSSCSVPPVAHASSSGSVTVSGLSIAP